MKSPMQTARRMPRQPGKRRQGRVGKGDVQFGQIKRKGALISLIGPLAKKRTFTIMALDWHITIITNQFGQNH
jgi:hypothetical protein